MLLPFSLDSSRGTIAGVKRWLLFLFCLPAWAGYSMKDLEFLANERNYQEFFGHAQDIRPAHRGERWQAMVKAMAHAYLKQHSTPDTYRQDTYQMALKLNSWPILHQDLEFQRWYGEFGRGYFAHCLRQRGRRSQCLELLYAYFGQGMKLPRQALSYLQLLAQQVPPLNARSYRLVKSLLQSPRQAQHCKHPLVKGAVIRELKRITYPSLSALKAWIAGKVSAPCREALATLLRKDLISPQFSRALLAFDILHASEQLSVAQRDFFLTRYYLNETVQGERLNLSWNTLKSLARDFGRRKKVLDQLQSLDPLPDKLFNLPSSPHKDIFMDHLAKNFPEYLDHYAKTCLRYLRSEGEFPQGNPTVHCHQVMADRRAKNWLGQQKLLLYQKARIPMGRQSPSG